MINRNSLNGRWPHVALGEVVEFLDHLRKPVTAKDREPGPYPYYGANGQQDSVADYIFDEPLVLLAEDGGYFGDSERTIAYRVDGKCWVNNHAHVLRPTTSRVDVRYLCRHLESYDVTPFISGTTRQKLTKAKAEAIPIALPPLPEQKRIADILDKADAIRRKRHEALTIASKTTSSLFYQEFGDPLFNPKEWAVVELADVSHKITDGVHFKPNYMEDGIPFISVKDITTGHLIFDEAKYITAEAHAEYIKRCHPEKGDVLLTKVGATYGRPALVDTDRPFSIYVSVALIKPDRCKIDPIFLKEVLASRELKRQADRAIKGAGVPDLHLVEIRQFRIPLPPLDIQEEFVTKTRAIRAIEEKLQVGIGEHDDLFNSLVQRAFKGEL